MNAGRKANVGYEMTYIEGDSEKSGKMFERGERLIIEMTLKLIREA